MRKLFAILLLLSVCLTGIRWTRYVDEERMAVLTLGKPVCDYRYFIANCIREETPYDPVAIWPRDACYPPIAYLLVKWFPLTERGETSYVWALFLGLFAGWALLVKEKVGTERIWELLPILGTGFFLAGPLRGNPAAWAAGLVFVFLAWYDSEVKWKRLVAALALGFSAALKIAPALFGLVYLRGRLARPREWPVRAIFVASLSFLVLLIVPFRFFGGGNALVPWFFNALENAGHYSRVSTVGFVELFNHRFLENNLLPLSVSLLMTKSWVVLALIAVLATVNRYRHILLLGSVMLLLGHHEYAYVYLLPAFMLWFIGVGTSNRPFFDRLECICWFVVLCPLPYTFSALVTLSHEMLRAFAALVLAGVSIGISTNVFLRRIRQCNYTSVSTVVSCEDESA